MAIPPGNGPYRDFAGIELDMRTVAANQAEFDRRLLTLEQQTTVAWLVFQTTSATAWEVTSSNGLQLTAISGSDATYTWAVPRTNVGYLPFGTTNLATDVGPAGSTYGPRMITLTTFQMRFAGPTGAAANILGTFPRIFFAAVLGL